MFFSYMMVKVIQTLMYTWYGTVITHESENFREGIYCSNWPHVAGERSLRPRMIIMLMQKPMMIKALKLCTLSVEMFVNVMNTTISYYFLLQTLNKRG
ncbi:odorant receptor Or2-like [Odontomachus brunneus]|uniref:odorant receptor Or2-like n=1 Tax=Odontomachus brunneus TaxID=486640 RepID=UPI0013F233FA|nr:odorant receptor Or2-like [Odontomachus brunneus]